MDTLEKKTMANTIEKIKVEDLLNVLQEKFKVTPKQELKITFEVIPSDEEEIDDSEFEIENLGDSVLESLQEFVEAKRKGIKLPDGDQLLKELQELN